jgi:gas vesicle protein
MNKFNKGLFLGGLLGAGAMWLNTTENGRDLRKKFIEHVENVYKLLKDKIQQTESYQELSRQDFKELLNEIAEKYADRKNLSNMTKKIIVEVINKHWEGIEAEIEQDKS